jgi:hypothetical protein
MQGRPEEKLRSELTLFGDRLLMDNATAVRLRKQAALTFRDQLTYGPRHRLHAKLYRFHPRDHFTPLIG